MFEGKRCQVCGSYDIKSGISIMGKRNVCQKCGRTILSPVVQEVFEGPNGMRLKKHLARILPATHQTICKPTIVFDESERVDMRGAGMFRMITLQTIYELDRITDYEIYERYIEKLGNTSADTGGKKLFSKKARKKSSALKMIIGSGAVFFLMIAFTFLSMIVPFLASSSFQNISIILLIASLAALMVGGARFLFAVMSEQADEKEQLPKEYQEAVRSINFIKLQPRNEDVLLDKSLTENDQWLADKVESANTHIMDSAVLEDLNMIYDAIHHIFMISTRKQIVQNQVKKFSGSHLPKIVSLIEKYISLERTESHDKEVILSMRDLAKTIFAYKTVMSSVDKRLTEQLEAENELDEASLSQLFDIDLKLKKAESAKATSEQSYEDYSPALFDIEQGIMIRQGEGTKVEYQTVESFEKVFFSPMDLSISDRQKIIRSGMELVRKNLSESVCGNEDDLSVLSQGVQSTLVYRSDPLKWICHLSFEEGYLMLLIPAKGGAKHQYLLRDTADLSYYDKELEATTEKYKEQANSIPVETQEAPQQKDLKNPVMVSACEAALSMLSEEGFSDLDIAEASTGKALTIHRAGDEMQWVSRFVSEDDMIYLILPHERNKQLKYPLIDAEEVSRYRDQILAAAAV